LSSRFRSVRNSNIHQIYNRVLYRKSRMIDGTELPVHVPYGAFYCGMGVEARCNLKCTMCPRNDPNFKEGEMPYDAFTRIMDQLPFLREVQLAGLGEPLLHGDLFKMIEYARTRKIRSVITTNGTLLNQRNIESVIQSGLGAVHVSVDSPDPEMYKSIRVGATLDHVTSNMRNLVQHRNEAGSRLQIIVNSILMRSNYHQVEDMIKLCADLGVDSISFSYMQYFLDVGISKESESLRRAPTSEKDEIRRRLAKAQKLADELRIEVGFPSLDQPKVRENCKQPWLYFMVKENGRVRPCCAIHDQEFGDLNQQSYKSIWNNDDFQSFRKRLLSNDVPAECKRCIFL